MAAIKLGKHVYCEKPLTHNVWEARQLAKAAKEAGVASQMGNHGHSGEGIRATCEYIWDGAIGTIKEVHAWSDTGRWATGSGRPKETPPVPATLDWDLWLGPREPRPYHPAYAPYNWRGWWAFGTGAIGDMACHNLDPAVWALDLRDPLTIEASAPGVDSEVVSGCTITRYHFGPRGNLPPVSVTWYDGGLRPERPAVLEEDEELGTGGNGILFLGEKGVIMCAGWGGPPRLLPEALNDSYKRPAKKLRRVVRHHRDWLDACKGGEPASGNFEYSARLTEIVLLGNISLRTRKKIYWDAANMKAKGVPAADPYLKESYRAGWEVA
jgi:predicted dehydrogenase